MTTMLERAVELGPLIRQYADQADRERRLAPEVARHLRPVVFTDYPHQKNSVVLNLIQ